MLEDFLDRNFFYPRSDLERCRFPSLPFRFVPIDRSMEIDRYIELFRRLSIAIIASNLLYFDHLNEQREILSFYSVLFYLLSPKNIQPWMIDMIYEKFHINEQFL